MSDLMPEGQPPAPVAVAQVNVDQPKRAEVKPLTTEEKAACELFRAHEKALHKQNADFRSSMHKSDDQQALTELKPFFKEWLEIRADFHEKRSDRTKLLPKETDELLDRCVKLRQYLEKMVLGPQCTAHLKEFKAWLEEHVRLGLRKFVSVVLDF